jgi:hypothetical protein
MLTGKVTSAPLAAETTDMLAAKNATAIAFLMCFFISVFVLKCLGGLVPFDDSNVDVSNNRQINSMLNFTFSRKFFYKKL